MVIEPAPEARGHIVHLAKSYAPISGGMERTTQFYAEAAADRGYHVSVVSLASDPDKTVEVVRPNLVVYRLHPDVSAMSGHFSLRYVTLARALARSASLLHVHEPNPLATVAALSLPAKAQIVVSWHSDVIRQKLALFALKPLQRALLRRAASICVQTAALIHESYALGGFAAKCFVLPTGLDCAPFDAASADLQRRAATNAEVGGPFVLAVGRLASYKGFDVLLRAIAGTDVRLVIVGDGAERERLKAIVSECGLAGQVLMAGEAPDQKVREYYSACEFFVLPSKTSAETFGLVQLEAMACGKPIINTALATGVPEVSLHGVTGLTVAPDDVAALRAATLSLWNDEASRRTLGEAARVRAHSEYSPGRVRDRLFEAYGPALKFQKRG